MGDGVGYGLEDGDGDETERVKVVEFSEPTALSWRPKAAILVWLVNWRVEEVKLGLRTTVNVAIVPLPLKGLPGLTPTVILASLLITCPV